MATMGDEDWEAEILKPHVSSYVPVFEKVINLRCRVIKCCGFLLVKNQIGEEVLTYSSLFSIYRHVIFLNYLMEKEKARLVFKLDNIYIVI